MFEICIKYFFIIFCAFYFYRKLLNLNFAKKEVLIQVISSLSLAILIYYIRLYFSSESVLVLAMSFTAIVYFIYKQPANITIITSLISIGCSYVIFILSILIFSPISLILMKKLANNTMLYKVSALFVGSLQMTLAIIPFKFNRLKTGMPFLKQQEKNEIGAFISISLLITVSFFNTSAQNSLSLLIPLFFVILSGILIFFWWKNKLTENYIQKLKEREINALQEEIQELKQYNETLSQIVHKDNKLIPAMELAVKNTLMEISNNADSNEKENLLSILSQLENISKERKGILRFSDNQAKSVYYTGSPFIDSILKYLSAKAYSKQINFDVAISQNVQTIIPDIISEADLRTLIADLVENAFIAVKNETHPHVLLQFRQEENSFIIEFFDNGIPFAQEVLEKLGKEPITTHKDENGTGIGYITTFEILRRCKATLDIDENLSIESFKKKISIHFLL